MLHYPLITVTVMVLSSDFDSTVSLPPGLAVSAIRKSIEFIEKRLADRDFVDLYLEQANIFSALVGMFGTKAMDTLSNYEKHRHSFTAQQRFPDLCRRGARKPLRPNDSLESKGSIRNYAIQSHYDHPGWYIIWRYLVDPTETIEKDKPVIIWRVDIVFLKKEDWKYEASSASASGGGRTHTFGVRRPGEKLRGKAVYRRSGIVVRDGKPVPSNGL